MKKENELIDSLIDDVEIKKEVRELKENNVATRAKEKSFSFLIDLMNSIDKSDALLKKAFEKIEEKIEYDQDLSIKDILSVVNIVSNHKNSLSDVILSLHKPQPGQPSTFSQAMTNANNNEDDIENFTNKLTTDELKTFDKMRKLLSMVEED